MIVFPNSQQLRLGPGSNRFLKIKNQVNDTLPGAILIDLVNNLSLPVKLLRLFRRQSNQNFNAMSFIEQIVSAGFLGVIPGKN